MSESLHALLSPSAAYRWMECTPSAVLESREPDQTSSFAEEGTCAHAIAAEWLYRLLQGEADLDFYTPTSKTLMDTIDAGLDPEEMTADVQPYVADVWCAFRRARDLDPTAKLLIEHRVSLERWAPGCWGTADAIVTGLGTLHVFDLKYGRGVKVNAYHNPQLMIYAAGALDLVPTAYIPREVEMTINQVRIQNKSDYTMMAQSLFDWAANELAPAARLALDCDGTLKPGSHCKFCRVAGKCPALAALSTVIEAEFGDPYAMTGMQLATVVHLIPAVRTWCDRAEIVAIGLAMEGNPVPGTKVVEGRSITKCINPRGAIDALKARGLKDEEITNMTLKPLGDIKKLLKGEYNEVMSPFVMRPPGKPTLVPSDDPRPAMDVSLGDGFEDVAP